MNVTFKWLQEYCEFDLPAQELAHKLTMAGLNVESMRQAGDDWVLELEITSNRPDLLGVIGVAREIAALTDSQLTIPSVDLAESGGSALTRTSRNHRDSLATCCRFAQQLTGNRLTASVALRCPLPSPCCLLLSTEFQHLPPRGHCLECEPEGLLSRAAIATDD